MIATMRMTLPRVAFVKCESVFLLKIECAHGWTFIA